MVRKPMPLAEPISRQIPEGSETINGNNRKQRSSQVGAGLEISGFEVPGIWRGQKFCRQGRRGVFRLGPQGTGGFSISVFVTFDTMEP